MCAGVQIRVTVRTRVVIEYARACMTHVCPQTTCVTCVSRRCENLNEGASKPCKLPSVTVGLGGEGVKRSWKPRNAVFL